MAFLILLRHLQSQWNQDNRFTGWVDIPLVKEERRKAKELVEKIFANRIDEIYTSPLIRNIETVLALFDYLPDSYPIFARLDAGKMQQWSHFTPPRDFARDTIPVLVYVSERLNERYYGELQGKDKHEAAKEFGAEQVRLWRRSYDIGPPGGESLKEVEKRVMSLYKKYMAKALKAGKNVLVVASHNSLRALAKNIEKIAEQDIINYEIPTGRMIVYELDDKLTMRDKKAA